MLDYSESPPPLHHSPATSDRESTPLTPVGFGPAGARRLEKDPVKDAHLPWAQRPFDVGTVTTGLYIDSSLLEPDFDDRSFPLFGASPPARGMAATAMPIEIATRPTSVSPRGRGPSNLTSALQKNSGGGARKLSGIEGAGCVDHLDAGKLADVGDGVTSDDNAAKPISMGAAVGDQARRGSLAQSLAGGMSWGGISVGSWIRDDIMMSGTSPFAFGNSPSYHSSSYLPKLEANFMRDFSCCGMTLPSLHDLLQHYEEAHAQRAPQPVRSNGADQSQVPDTRSAMATNAVAAVQQQTQEQGDFKHTTPAQASPRPNQTQPNQPKGSTFSMNLQTIPDMDTLDDMEMDDMDAVDEKTSPPGLYTQPQSSNPSPRAQFSQPHQSRLPRLNMSILQGHQGLRTSTPTTPIAQGRQGLPYQNNPTVSSVNTPTLMSNPMQQQFQDLSGQYRSTPDSSAPGTPADPDDGITGGMGDMSMQSNMHLSGSQNQNFSLGAFGVNADTVDLCIDEPAKRLFSPTGGYGTHKQQPAHRRLGSGQYGPNSDIARRIREQQRLAGLPDTTAGLMPNDEPRPFRCPVIGCEKAYKNQNGLKYHKGHGHKDDRLCKMADNTYRLMNPETLRPYEGTSGMQFRKPHKCETCGKRYKNPNGLKYHKSHSPACDPEFQNNRGCWASAGQIPDESLAMAVSGAGLPAASDVW